MIVNTRAKILFISLIVAGCQQGASDIEQTIIPPVSVKPEQKRITVTVAQINSSASHSCNLTSQVVNNDPNLIRFSEISKQIGLDYVHTYLDGEGIFGQSGGVAAGDFDNDGWVDLYAVRGTAENNLLLKNKGDGSFIDVATNRGLAFKGEHSGPAFGDFNGDGWLDLFVGSVNQTSATLFVNDSSNLFSDITSTSGLSLPGNNFSASWGDIDNDDDLDLFITHWTRDDNQHYAFLWRNNGDSTFTDISDEMGLKISSLTDKSFSPSFVDINSDGWQDILLVADGGNSRVLINQQGEGFIDIKNDVISERSGMGSAVGDYDNDGDLDWFVTAISAEDGVVDGGWGTSGNRLYQNNGDGTFLDKTDEANVRHGFWGWGACFADFNNDGFLDIFHVNGFTMESDIFLDDPSRLYISQGDGTFKELAVESGIDDRGQGRGLVCFDYDRDGDMDIMVANHNQAPAFFCNHGNANHFINIRLVDSTLNTQALGARIYVTTGTTQQMRELNSGNNYVSQNPVEAQFGLASATIIDELKIIWPDGEESRFIDVAPDRFLIITRNKEL
jgi:enediyne biosynthesis protein E4